MTLLEKLKSAQLQARKDRDKVTSSLLTTLLGDAVMVGKNDGNRDSTDVEVVATIKKFINNAQITADALSSNTNNLDAYTTALNEIRILNTFLPKQWVGDELIEVLNNVIAHVGAKSPADMGKVMKALKEFHAGTYDGALASKLIKEQLVSIEAVLKV